MTKLSFTLASLINADPCYDELQHFSKSLAGPYDETKMDKLIINGLNGLDNVTAFNSDDKLTVTIGSSKLLTLDEA